MQPLLQDDASTEAYVSTGTLPSSDRVAGAVAEAHKRFRSITDGQNSNVYPALEEVPSHLFGVCMVGTNGNVYAAGDTDYEFSIMSVSKPFVFALVCQAIGAESAREKLGANATGMPFNSLPAVERSPDGRTNQCGQNRLAHVFAIG
jgi:glutaminase